MSARRFISVVSVVSVVAALAVGGEASAEVVLPFTPVKRSPPQVEPLIGDVIANNADAVAGYRAGKTATFGFLVGQVMKASQGKANPKVVSELLKDVLK